MGRALGDAIGLGDGVGRGVAVGVAVAVAVGVGVGVPPPAGAWIATVMEVPVLKKPTVAFAGWGGWVESKRKLYKVPQRMALAFWFCAKVSVLQIRALPVSIEVQGALLNPASPTVPSLGNPGWLGGA